MSLVPAQSDGPSEFVVSRGSAKRALSNWVKIGEENYFVNTADGRLMPSKKGQQPPDLFYFKLPQK